MPIESLIRKTPFKKIFLFVLLEIKTFDLIKRPFDILYSIKY